MMVVIRVSLTMRVFIAAFDRCGRMTASLWSMCGLMNISAVLCDSVQARSSCTNVLWRGTTRSGAISFAARHTDESTPDAPRKYLEEFGESDSEVNVVDYACAQRVDGMVHQRQRDRHILLLRSESKGLEEEHCAGNDTEVGADGTVLEVVSRQEAFHYGAEKIPRRVNDFGNVRLVLYRHKVSKGDRGMPVALDRGLMRY